MGLKQSHWISWDHPCEAGPGHLSQEGGGDSLGFVVLCDPTTSGFQTKAKNSEDPVNPFSFPLHLWGRTGDKPNLPAEQGQHLEHSK